MAEGALGDQALDNNSNELTALAISAASRRFPCIPYPVGIANKLGIKQEKILKAMGVATRIGAEPNVMCAAQGQEAFDQLKSAGVSSMATEISGHQLSASVDLNHSAALRAT